MNTAAVSRLVCRRVAGNSVRLARPVLCGGRGVGSARPFLNAGAALACRRTFISNPFASPSKSTDTVPAEPDQSETQASTDNRDQPSASKASSEEGVAEKEGASTEPEESAADAPSAREVELENAVEAQKTATSEAKDALRRLAADFDNYQRISKRSVEEAREKGINKFAVDLLDSLDTLTMALKSVPEDQVKESAHLANLYNGVAMTSTVLLKTLSKYGIEQQDPTGKMFDPNMHEAMYMAPVLGKEPGTILECQKLGYTFKGRSLRAAQVGVAQESPA